MSIIGKKNRKGRKKQEPIPNTSKPMIFNVTEYRRMEMESWLDHAVKQSQLNTHEEMLSKK